jgi:hypothetical protein
MYSTHVYAPFAESVQEQFTVVEVGTGSDHDDPVACCDIVFELLDHGCYGTSVGEELSGITESTKIKLFTGL